MNHHISYMCGMLIQTPEGFLLEATSKGLKMSLNHEKHALHHT